MAAVTAAVVAGAAATYSARKKEQAARSASRTQAEGVANAQAETRRASEAALPIIERGFQQGRQDIRLGADRASGELRQGFGAGREALQQGFGAGINTLQPIANRGLDPLNESFALLGLGGETSQAEALGRVSDPLQAEQERAFARNAAGLGAVGGNQLAELAELTRSRTEANIGNRLNQLSQAASPGLAALQQISQFQVNQGQQLSGLEQQGGIGQARILNDRAASLAQLAAQGGTTQGNAILSQGTQLAQLAQNRGNALAGFEAFRAQNDPAVAQGIRAGIGAFTGFGGSTPPPQTFSGGGG